MGSTSNKKYYTIGKGVGYFNPLNAGTGLFEGTVDLGNISNFAFSVDTEKLDHYSSRGGLKAKDLSIISQISPKFTFTADEMQPENVGRFMLGDTEKMTQTAASVVTEEFTANAGTVFFLANRNAFVNVLNYDAGTTLFVVGDVVTGGTSSATGTVLAVSGTATEGKIYLGAITGTFADNEDLEVSASAKAVANGTVSKGAGVVVINKTTKTTVYVGGTDYSANGKIGKVTIPEDTTIPAATVVEVKYAADSATYYRVKGYTKAANKGEFRFQSDNPAGTNFDITYWSVDLKPSGDLGMIGDDWMAMTFEAEVFKDEAGHPDNPFCDVKIFPAA